MTPITSISDDEKMFVEEVNKFAETKIKPRVMEMDEAEQFDPELIQEMFAMGLMGIEVPENYGGSGGSFTMAVLAIEEIAKVDPSAAVVCDVQNTLINNIFLNYANEEQRKTYLPILAQEKMASYCLTEADSGSDAFALQTRAIEEADHYVLDGKKVFITNAKEAEYFVVFANINPDLGYKGITAFLVDKSMPGCSLGKKEKKLGIRSSSTCEVVLEGVRVPKANIIGELGKGYKIAIGTLNEGRIGIAAQMLGLAEGALGCAHKYASERSQFGKPLSKFQAIQFKLAELATDIYAAKAMLYNTARMKDSGEDFIKEAAMCKYHVGKVAEKVSSEALEVFGGYGFIKEYPAEKYYRDAKIGALYEGTSHMQLSTIFKMMS